MTIYTINILAQRLYLHNIFDDYVKSVGNNLVDSPVVKLTNQEIREAILGDSKVPRLSGASQNTGCDIEYRVRPRIQGASRIEGVKEHRVRQE